MDERSRTWHPDARELEQILREMRPIIREFVRRSEQELAAAARHSGRGLAGTSR